MLDLRRAAGADDELGCGRGAHGGGVEGAHRLRAQRLLVDRGDDELADHGPQAAELRKHGRVARSTVERDAPYLPIGLSVAPALRGSIPRRVLEAQLAVDEAWAIAHVGDGRYDRDRLVGAGVIVFVAWVSGTGLGVLGGSVLGDPAALGLDVLSPALFLALLVAQVRDARAAGAALLGASIALACIPWAPAGVPIVAASLVALLGLKGGRR